MTPLFDPDTPNTGVILGIDPGTRTIGFCAMEIDLTTKERVSFDAFTVHAERPCGGRAVNEELYELHTELFARMQEIASRFYWILQEYKPIQVVSELPFMNTLQPSAYGPLVQVIRTLELQLTNWNPWRPLYRIENTAAKAMIYPKDKEERKKIQLLKGSKARIAACLVQHPDFQWLNPDEHDEHSIDATLVAECQRRRLAVSDYEVRS